MMDGCHDGTEAFVTFGRGLLHTFNPRQNCGFISPVFKKEDSEGPPLPTCCDQGLHFFGDHTLPARAVNGLELTFEIWENSQGTAQARAVQVAAETTMSHQPEERSRELATQRERPRGMGLHPNEPRVIYPSVYVSDVPVEWSEQEIRGLHRQLGLNPDTIMGLKFLPFTEVSLGANGAKPGVKQATPVTGSVILRYLNEEAANAGVERLKGHPIQTSAGVSKHLGAKHATPPKWVVQRKQAEDDEKKSVQTSSGSRGEAISQKVTGFVVRVSMSGYGVIKSAEWGEVMWRQYELPTNLRTMQFSDKSKFTREVETREDYRRLKEMEGKQVEASLYKLPDGTLRASHVRNSQADYGTPMLENGPGPGGSMYPGGGFGGPFGGMQPPGGAGGPMGGPMGGPCGGPCGGGGDRDRLPPPPGPPPSNSGKGGDGKGDGKGGMPGMPGMPPGMHPGMMPPGMHPGMMGPPGMGPPGMGPPGMGPPGMMFDPAYQAQMMQAMQAMHGGKVKKEKKDKKDKKEKKEKKRKNRSGSEDGDARADEQRGDEDQASKRRKIIDDDDF